MNALDELKEAYKNYSIGFEERRSVPDIIQEAYDVAAKDPSAWRIEAHGEVFHLGDRVWFGGFEQEINGFVRAVDDTTIGIRLNVSGLVDPSEISHENPDTWEKLQHDVIESIFREADANESVELGRAFVSRAKNLRSLPNELSPIN